MRKRMMIVAASLACGLSAQQEHTFQIQFQPAGRIGTDSEAGTMAKQHAELFLQNGAAGSTNATFSFISSEMSFDGKLVKGAPYSAEAVNESVQTLSDGNRIVHKTSSLLYRDSEGRTRNEINLAPIGAMVPEGGLPTIISINDPVAQVRYTLNSREKTAAKITTSYVVRDTTKAEIKSQVEAMQAKAQAEALHRGTMASHNGHAETVMIAPSGETLKPVAPPVTESLGKQTIEGVVAEGTRTTMTIAAGSIGNERDLQIVSERWYSPELQTVVMTKRSDPRLGESTYRLTNLRRGEPSPSLFQVPADYTIAPDRMMPRRAVEVVRP